MVEEALRQQDPKAAVELKGVDWESLRILQGQRLELALEVGGSRTSDAAWAMCACGLSWRHFRAVAGAFGSCFT